MVTLNKDVPPAYLVIAAMDLPSGFKKGDIVEVLASGNLKSDVYVPPKFIWAEITDVSKVQVDNYLMRWEIMYNHTLLSQNDNGWRYEIAVDPIYISVSGKNQNQIKQEMADYLNTASTDLKSWWYGSSIVSWTQASIIIDIPKPFSGNPAYDGNDPLWLSVFEANWPGFRNVLYEDFKKRFDDIIEFRRYYFRHSAVDAVVGSGGEWIGTHAQALNYIVDKLEE